MNDSPHLLLSRLTGFLLALLACSGSASATDATAWSEGEYSQVRLVGAGPQPDTPALLAGVEIRMDEGWKTYWRNPGDSGVPPSFDWSGSTNLKKAEVLYPAPHRFSEAGGTAIGYGGDVIFPVKITPEREGEPVQLKLAMEYGICKTLCVPNQAELTLTLPANASRAQASDSHLSHFMDRVPRPADPGALPALRAVDAKLDGQRPEILLDIEFPAFAKGADVFIDGGDAFVPVPTPVGKASGGAQRYEVVFASQAEADRIKGKPLRVTLVTDNGSREANITVE
jgi:DsbC/DsbD-like thiol-disulfide interchange protein